MTTPRRRPYDDPLNPWQEQTREEHMANRSQRNFDTAFDTRASQQDRATALRTTTGLPGAVPRSASRGSPMSAYDRAEQVRRNALLPGAKPTALTGPATAQNTGVTGVKASTPDFGSTRRLPGQSTETFMPDSRGGRYVGSVSNPPPRTDVARPKSAPAPLDIKPPVAATPVAGVRTVAIDPKYQAPGGPATGTSVEQWRHDLKAQHPEIFKAGTPENLAFVAAHKNEDGSMRPIDGTKAIGIADQVKQQVGDANYALENEGRIKELSAATDKAAQTAQAEKGTAMGDAMGAAAASAVPAPRVTTNGANRPAVAVTPSATPRVTTNGANNPAVPEGNPNFTPLVNKAIGGATDLYANYQAGKSALTDRAKEVGLETLGTGINRTLNPLQTGANRVMDAVGKVGGAVGSAVLSPQGQRKAGEMFGSAREAVDRGAAAADAALRSPLHMMGLPQGLGTPESDEAKRKRLGLP